MKNINFTSLYEIKLNLKKYILGEKIYKEMVAISAIEFKRYINAWLKDKNITWEEFSIKNHLLENFDPNQLKELDCLDILANNLYYQDDFNAFLRLKEICELENLLKQEEKINKLSDVV